MSQYKIGRPLSDVRLRNWDAGRLSQLKLTVQRLEAEVNKTQAASVKQSSRRKVTDQVPFIMDLSVNPGFRQVVVDFTAPPGLGGHPRRQLLFYEIQHASSSNFADPTILQTPNTHVNIAGFSLGETRSFRARVVNTLGEASPWTNTTSVQLARNQIQQTYLTDVNFRLVKEIGEWETVFDNIWQPVDSKACCNVHVALACPHFDVTQTGGGATRTLYGGPASVQFRWKIATYNYATLGYDMKVKGVRAILSARPGYTAEADVNEDYNSVRTPTAFGTLMTPFFTPTSGVPMRVILEASKMPGSEWMGPTKARGLETSDPIVITRRGQIIEVLAGF